MSAARKSPLKNGQAASKIPLEKSSFQCVQLEEDSAEKRKVNNDANESNVDAVSAHSMKVYLRLKPCPANLKSSKIENVYNVLNHSTLLTKFPTVDHNTRASVTFKPKDNGNRKCTFTKIFHPEATQTDVFEQSVKSQVEDFLLGQSSTIFTYGTANSGKTYTLYGIPEFPGIIPRSIQLIFSAINCTLSPWYKPVNGCIVVSLDDAKRIFEDRKKKNILNPRRLNENQSVAARKSLEKSEFENSQEETIECNGENLYSVWLSLAEIYNENVYDLLVEDDGDVRNVPLKLIRGKDGSAYVNGLKTVYATTALEAYQIVISAQSKMRVAPTTLNSESSRSHTIFSMKLLKYQKANVPHEVSVGTLTFCDLAGSGRSRKTQDSKTRQQEARNINNSLLVLGRCLKAVWEGQLNKQNVDNVIGLFRESKLTRMFQRALIGREPVTFLVNIDPSPNLYVETQSVLNFCTVAKKIAVERSKETRKSISSELNVHSRKISSATDVVSPETSDSTDHDCPTISDEEKEKCGIDSLNSRERHSLQIKNSDSFIEIIPESFDYSLKEQSSVVREETRESVSRSTSEEGNLQRKMLTSLNSSSETSCLIDNENENLSKMENVDLVKKLETVKIVALKRECEIRQELKNHYRNVIDGLESNWKEHTKEILQNLNVPSYRDAATSPRYVKTFNPMWKEDNEALKNENKRLLEEVECLKTAALNNERKIREEMAEKYAEMVENMEKTWKKRTQEVEEEGQDLLKWSVNQVQNFYQERIDSLKRTKKRKRSDRDEEVEEEFSDFEDLEAENYQVTSKVVILRESVKKLREENELLSLQKNKCSFELAIAKEKLKSFQELVRSKFGDCLPSDECDKENLSSRFVNKLKNIIDSKLKTIDKLEKDLEDVRTNYLKISSASMKTKRDFSDAKKMLQENQLQINQLTENLAEKTNEIKKLQAQLNVRDKQLLDVKKSLTDAKDKDEITSRRIQALEEVLKNLESQLRNTSLRREDNLFDHKCKFEENATQSSYCKLSFTMDDSSMFDVTSNSTLPVLSQVDSMKEIHEQLNLNCQSNRSLLNISGHISVPESSESGDQSINRSSNCSSKNDSGIIANSHRDIVIHDEEETVDRSNPFWVLFQKDIAGKSFPVAKLTGALDTLKQTLHSMDKISKDNRHKMMGVSKCVEEFTERCADFQSRLQVACGQLDKLNVKCECEHIGKIERLEKELLTKTFRINELESKAMEGEKDLARVLELGKKVNEFKGILEKCQEEKVDLWRQLQERSENQMVLEKMLKNFNSKVQEKENELTSLKTEFGNIVHTNVANSEKVKELNDQISEMIQMIKIIKMDLLHSEELRGDIEKSSRQEISTLKLRLAAFEKDTAFLSLIQENNNEKHEELERLKSQLREKECELILFKKNRDETIHKYETLVKQLQDDLDKRNDQDSNDHYVRYRLSKCIEKSGRPQSLLKPKDNITKPSCINKEFADEKSPLSSSTLSLSKKCSPQVTGLSLPPDHDVAVSSINRNADFPARDNFDLHQIESHASISKSVKCPEDLSSVIERKENQNEIQLFGWMKMGVSRVTPTLNSAGSLYGKALSGWMKVKKTENNANLLESSEECTDFDEETSEKSS